MRNFNEAEEEHLKVIQEAIKGLHAIDPETDIYFNIEKKSGEVSETETTKKGLLHVYAVNEKSRQLEFKMIQELTAIFTNQQQKK